MNAELSGSEILVESLISHKADTIFGYPGSCVMLILDRLFDCAQINHILVRHEQGAVHAACSYARFSHKPGIVLTTSGPGATNTVTGIAEAMSQQIPLIVITGQVASNLLGTDAFQEVDIIGITSSITKWNFQIRLANQIEEALERAFRIATSNPPGPVVLDITKDAQSERTTYNLLERNRNPLILLNRNKFPTDYLSNDNALCHTIKLLENRADDNLILIIDAPLQNRNEHCVPGFGLPASIGAKYACPEKTVCLIVGSREFQANIQELGVIKEKAIDIKIFLIHDHSDTKFKTENPDFAKFVSAYAICCTTLSDIRVLNVAIETALHTAGAYFLEIQP